MRSSTPSDLCTTLSRDALYSMVPSSVAKSRGVSSGICTSGLTAHCHSPKKRSAEDQTDTRASKKRLLSKLPPTPSQSPLSTPLDTFSRRKQNTSNTLPKDPKSTTVGSKDILCDETSDDAIVTTTIQSRPSVPQKPKRGTVSNAPEIFPKSLQFINNVAPEVPRPKQPAAGTYVQTQSAIQQKARKRVRDEGKIKRPSNCFIKYRTQVLPEIVARFGNQNNKEISKLAAQCWKEEPEWVKSHFRQQALEEQRMLKALYPSYKYNPSRGSQPKGKNNKNSASVSKDGAASSSADSLPSSDGTRGDPGVEHGVDPENDKPSARDKSGSKLSQPSKSKQDKEKMFVVTEMALHEFTGDSDFAAKMLGSAMGHTRSRSTGSTNGSKPISVGQHLLTQQSVLEPDLPKDPTVVTQASTSTLIAPSPHSNTTNLVMDQQDGTSLDTAPELSSSMPGLVLADSTMPTANSWHEDVNTEQRPGAIATMIDGTPQVSQAQEMLGMTIDEAIGLSPFAEAVVYSSLNNNSNYSGLQDFSLNLENSALGFHHPTTTEMVHAHNSFSISQQQTLPSTCGSLDQGFLWHFNIIPESIVPTGSEETSQHLSVPAVVSVLPPTPVLTPILASMGTIDPTDPKVIGRSPLMEPVTNTSQLPSSGSGHHVLGQDQTLQLIRATTGPNAEWLTISHAPPTISALTINQQFQHHQQPIMTFDTQVQLPPSIATSSSLGLGNSARGSLYKVGHVSSSSAVILDTSNYLDYLETEWLIPTQEAPTQMTNSTGVMSGMTVPQQQQYHLHSSSIEELTMSIEYHERLVELQKMQLAQLQSSQQSLGVRVSN